jgi:magnesium transporter
MSTIQSANLDSGGPQRTGSRGSDRQQRNSRNNSRTQVPVLGMGYGNEHLRRNRSSTSLDSEALFNDHRGHVGSMPRPSFLHPSTSRRKSKQSQHAHRRGSRVAHKQSTLGMQNEGHGASESSDDSSDHNERSALIGTRQARRTSSSQQSFRPMPGGYMRRGSDNPYGTMDETDRGGPNPNYPPSIPSSYASRRPSAEQLSTSIGRIRNSISGKDENGDMLSMSMAQRVLEHARRGGPSACGSSPDHSNNLAHLPDVISTSPPQNRRASQAPLRNFREEQADSAFSEPEDGDKRGRIMSRAEEDVCFPLSDDGAVHGHIDFEELTEWAREQVEQKEDGSTNNEWRHRKLSEPMLVNGKYRNRGGWASYDRSDEDVRPFRFTFFSDELQSTIHSPTLYELPQEDQSFQDLFTTGNTWWLDVNCPTDSEMKILSSAFGIHPLTCEDVTMEEQREKVELFRNYYLISFRSFQQDPNSDDYLEPVNMYIVVFRDGVLSFHFTPTPHPANVRRRIRQLRDYITVSSDWISYALIDDIVDAFSPLIHRIDNEVDLIDDNVLGIEEETHEKSKGSDISDSEQTNMLRRIGSCRKKVMGLLRLLGSKADVVKGFAKRCNEQWDVAPRSEIGLYLGDIQDHIVTMVQNLNHYEKILSRSHSNYLAQININMTKVNNDTNDVLSRLTVVGTMLLPCSLVTGLWGMNVPVPGQESEGTTWFFGIVGCMAIFFVLVYVLGRRSGVV